MGIQSVIKEIISYSMQHDTSVICEVIMKLNIDKHF